MGKATDEAGEMLKERVTEAADSAAFTIDEHAKEMKKKVEALEKEVQKARDDIRFERGFRKFFFWPTPILLLLQTAISVSLLLK